MNYMALHYNRQGDHSADDDSGLFGISSCATCNLISKSDFKLPTTHCDIPEEQCWNPDPDIRFCIKVHNSAL